MDYTCILIASSYFKSIEHVLLHHNVRASEFLEKASEAYNHPDILQTNADITQGFLIVGPYNLENGVTDATRPQ
jgi:hypothetical protein